MLQESAHRALCPHFEILRPETVPLQGSRREHRVTVSLRIPRDGAEQMQRYAARHRHSITARLLDGLLLARLGQGLLQLLG